MTKINGRRVVQADWAGLTAGFADGTGRRVRAACDAFFLSRGMRLESGFTNAIRREVAEKQVRRMKKKISQESRKAGKELEGSERDSRPEAAVPISPSCVPAFLSDK